MGDYNQLQHGSPDLVMPFWPGPTWRQQEGPVVTKASTGTRNSSLSKSLSKTASSAALTATKCKRVTEPGSPEMQDSYGHMTTRPFVSPAKQGCRQNTSLLRHQDDQTRRNHWRLRDKPPKPSPRTHASAPTRAPLWPHAPGPWGRSCSICPWAIAGLRHRGRRHLPPRAARAAEAAEAPCLRPWGP